MKGWKRALILPWAGGANPLAYTNKVLGIETANLIAYWPMADASGPTATDASGNGRNGTYTNSPTLGQPGIGDGRTCPSFDASNDFVNIYSASLGGAFNGQEGTAALWMKASGAGVWTDSTARRGMNVEVDGNNRIILDKSNASNLIRAFYIAGGTSKSVSVTTSSVDWFHFAITWSKSGDQAKVYLNGAQQGATQTSLGTFAGSLGSANCTIAATSTSANNLWSGWLAHAAIWTTPLSAAQVLSLATV